MPPHSISTCAACAEDIWNARDRCEPIRGSRTVRRRAALSGSRTSEPADSVEKKSFPDVKKLIGSVRPLALRVRNAPRQLLGPQGFAGSSEFHAFEAFWGPCRAAGVTLVEALIPHDLRRRLAPRDACALCRPIGIIARGQKV